MSNVRIILRRVNGDHLSADVPAKEIGAFSTVSYRDAQFRFAQIRGGVAMFDEIPANLETLDITQYFDGCLEDFVPGEAISVSVRRKAIPSLQVGSGILLPIMNTDPSKINMVDIAESIAKICRYNGHTSSFYSVAEHSVHIYDYLTAIDATEEERRCGLMHDAPEYIVGDMTKPLKDMVGLPFKRVEAQVWSVIAERFGLPVEIPEIVNHADLRMLFTEKAQVFAKEVDWGWNVDPLPNIEIKFWSWDQAVIEFLLRASQCGLVTGNEVFGE